MNARYSGIHTPAVNYCDWSLCM